MKIILTILLFLVVAVAQAQAPKISFQYDNAGNQVQRIWCPNCSDRVANETPKEISKLQESDLQKFFPEGVISYYPNPVKEELYLKWELINDNKVTSIQIYSLNGQLFKESKKLENANNQVFNFQNYPVGIYLLQLNYADGEAKTIKIIKK